MCTLKMKDFRNINKYDSPGSMSPRQRSKKMAPAPPPAPRTLNTQTTGDFDNSYSSPTVAEVQRSPPKLPSSGPTTQSVYQPNEAGDQSANVISQTAPIFPKLSSSK